MSLLSHAGVSLGCAERTKRKSNSSRASLCGKEVDSCATTCVVNLRAILLSKTFWKLKLTQNFPSDLEVRY